MPAILTWLDYDTDDRERMHRILALFRERDTRDELGVGVIRDLLADELFPGTSTIQTRLRYMLFVPWIYQGLEDEEWSSAEIAGEARRREVALVKGLLKSDDKAGIFGKLAGEKLDRLPSSVYWSGLGSWGIRKFPGSQEQYHSSVNEIYRCRADRRRRVQSAERRGEGMDAVGNYSGVTWHPQLPEPPATFPPEVEIGLTAHEAHFVIDQVTAMHRHSLLVQLLNRQPADVEFPWEHPHQGSFSAEHRQLLHHGRLFSELMHGAALLYNLMLAEKVQNQTLIDEHRDASSEWADALDLPALNVWNFGWVTDLAMKREQLIPMPTREFCQRWLASVLSSDGKLFDQSDARNLIHARETRLKGSRSRFLNQRAIDQWNGHAGMSRMNYRWLNVQRFVKDLNDALVNARARD